MRIRAIAAAFGIVAALGSGPVFAQANTDSASSQPAQQTSNATLRAQNHQLSKAVRQALHSTKGLTSSNIAVLAKGGVVFLIGTVPNDSQIAMAGDVARRVPQVKSVDNRLVVEEEQEEGGQ